MSLVVGGTGKKDVGRDLRSGDFLVDPGRRDPASHAQSTLPILLSDGRVLVTGGLGVKNSAEIFDPATMSWTAAPDMVQARYRHAAAVLSDGRVLIAGGNSEEEALAESELFVP